MRASQVDAKAGQTVQKMRVTMEKFKKIFEKYRVYLTRPRIEIATVLLIAICAVSVFLLNTPKKGVLTLDNGALVYDGTLVRGKMNGQGTMTFENGDQYTGEFNNGLLMVKGLFNQRWLEIRR